MDLRAGRVAVMVAVGIVVVSGGGCASRSDLSLANRSTTTTSPASSSTVTTTSVPTTSLPTTTASSTTTLQPPTTAAPTTTGPALVPGGSCTLGSHPDCIDPDGDGAGRYLLFGAECMADFSDAPELCSDLDQDGIAGYPDSG